MSGRKGTTRSGSVVLEAIELKKRGGELPGELIRKVVEGYTEGEIPDYKM